MFKILLTAKILSNFIKISYKRIFKKVILKNLREMMNKNRKVAIKGIFTIERKIAYIKYKGKKFK